MARSALQRIPTMVVLVLVVTSAIAGATFVVSTASLTTDAIDGTGATPVEPTLSVPSEVNQSTNVTATVALPAAANGTQEFVVSLDSIGGGTLASRNVTLGPGDATHFDLGGCWPGGNYVVRVTAPNGDVLVADTVEVVPPDPRVSLDGATRGDWDSTVAKDGTLRLNATYHGCRERATIELRASDRVAVASEMNASSNVAWRATVIDADRDGNVSFRWDVDGATGERLRGAPGTALANVTDSGVGMYGQYTMRVLADDRFVTNRGVAVSFADPAIGVYRLDPELDASGALDAARSASPVSSSGDAEVVDGDWVVLRVDTDGTLDSLPTNASLVAPASHENATIRIAGAYAGPSEDPDDHGLDLANATRRFDPESGTLWYAYRADADDDHARVTYAATRRSDDSAREAWEATATMRIRTADAVHFRVEGIGLLPPARNVTLEGFSALPEGTNLSVAAHVDGRVVAETTAVVDDERVRPTLDLSAVANGTPATLVVRDDDGRVVYEQDVTVVSKPVLVLRGFHVRDGFVAGQPATVRVYVLNRGTIRGNATVSVAIGSEYVTRSVSLAPDEARSLEVQIPASMIQDSGEIELRASYGGETETRSFEVQPATTTYVDPLTTTSVDRQSSTGTEPWPTLAGGDRRTEDSSIPGFGPLVAVVALAAAVGLVARRAKADGE